MKRGFRPIKVFMIIVCAAGFLVLFTFIVMWLWNAILPAVLGVKMITFWQALGILVLSKILFSGFGGAHHKRHAWKERMREKFQHMTPEEKEKFKQQWKDRCGRFGSRRFEDKERFTNTGESGAE
jgi:Ca2+/H+ antiporter, TMEM165/GDT1 family